MDIEQIIKRIAEEVYGQIRAEEANNGGSAGVQSASAPAAETVYSYMRITATVKDIADACNTVKNSGASVLCVPEWFVDTAAQALKGSNKRVATFVGLPGGATSSFAKYAEAKQAVVSGAEMVFIPVNMQLLNAGDWNGARNDLAETMVPCKGKAAVMAVLEVDSLSLDQLTTAAGMCAACGVDCVMLSAVNGGRPNDSHVKAVKGQGVRVGIYGGVTDGNRAAYQSAGATMFAVSRV